MRVLTEHVFGVVLDECIDDVRMEPLSGLTACPVDVNEQRPMLSLSDMTSGSANGAGLEMLRWCDMHDEAGGESFSWRWLEVKKRSPARGAFNECEVVDIETDEFGSATCCSPAEGEQASVSDDSWVIGWLVQVVGDFFDYLMECAEADRRGCAAGHWRGRFPAAFVRLLSLSTQGVLALLRALFAGESGAESGNVLAAPNVGHGVSRSS